jgi:NAD(P)H dehydrogenase (quinone)
MGKRWLLFGLLHGKKVVIINSMGRSYDEYEQMGMFDALRLTIDKGVFEFTGMEVVEHKYFPSIMSANDELREEYLQEIRDISNRLIQETVNKTDKKRIKRVA